MLHIYKNIQITLFPIYDNAPVMDLFHSSLEPCYCIQRNLLKVKVTWNKIRRRHVLFSQILECAKAEGEDCVVVHVKGKGYGILMTAKNLHMEWNNPLVKNPLGYSVRHWLTKESKAVKKLSSTLDWISLHLSKELSCNESNWNKNYGGYQSVTCVSRGALRRRLILTCNCFSNSLGMKFFCNTKLNWQCLWNSMAIN